MSGVGDDAIPKTVAEAAARALSDGGPALVFRRADPLGGGCIHRATRVESMDGREAFLKWSDEPGFSGFGVEARGLRALAEREALRIPQVLGFESGGDGSPGWLLLEFVRPGVPSSSGSHRLGEGLATLHHPLQSASAGWEEDGWIGTLPQPNGPAPDWPMFWRDFRLLPTFSRVAARLDPDTRALGERLFSEIHAALAGWEEDGLSLLHGDLWSGNVLWDETGAPVLLDPAVYRGHREVDLAMMELFGGFAAPVFEAYTARAPLAPGYTERRRDAYQLYPLLVHLALFGEGYLMRARDCLRRVIRSLP